MYRPCASVRALARNTLVWLTSSEKKLISASATWTVGPLPEEPRTVPTTTSAGEICTVGSADSPGLLGSRSTWKILRGSVESVGGTTSRRQRPPSAARR